MGIGNFFRNEIVGGALGDVLSVVPGIGDAINSARQREQESYQRQQDALTRAREDNAVQRRSADLQAAGLSQTLAAGNAAAASGVSPRSAAQGNTKWLGETASALMGVLEGVENLDLLSSQAGQARSASLLNYARTFRDMQTLPHDVQKTIAETAHTQSQTDINKYDYAQAYNYKSKFVREPNTILDYGIRAYDVFRPILENLVPGADGVNNSVVDGIKESIQQGMERLLPPWMKSYRKLKGSGASGSWKRPGASGKW